MSQPPVVSDQQLCAICQCAIGADEERTHCPDCNAPYHADCWRDNGGCGVYGCSKVPPTEKLADVEVPVSYWGQENKPCPACGQTILAAALRCRNCGATFESARPQDTAEFMRGTSRKQRSHGVRVRAIWILITCLIPFTAPFATVIGGLWYRRNRADLAALPTAYRALCLIGLIVGAGQTALYIILTALYSAMRGS